jgi:hypothetical protein
MNTLKELRAEYVESAGVLAEVTYLNHINDVNYSNSVVKFAFVEFCGAREALMKFKEENAV